MSVSEIEQNPPPRLSDKNESTYLSQADINKWVEVGRSEFSPLIFGASTEKIIKATKTGIIPAHRPTLPYQKELTKNGGFIYYFLPNNLATLDESIPGFEDSFKQRTGFSNDDFIKHMRLNRNGAMLYAQMNAFTDGFFSLTGYKPKFDNIIESMRELLTPSEKKELVSDSSFLVNDLEDTLVMDETNDYKNMRESFKDEDLHDVLREIAPRRGLLAYFNTDILKLPETSIHPGFEDESEVNIVSSHPLPVSCISGIECLSELDKTNLTI